MELRPGYKRTEVGAIPEEWEVQPLATLTTGVSSGKSKPIKGASNFPVFGSTGIIGHTDKPAYEGKAILVARVGANAGTLNVVTGQYGVTDNTIILSTSESALPDFLWRVLQTKRLNSLVFGSGQPLITGTQLKALSIQLPSLDEQRAIATALSDVDALLTQLDRLIAKKRDIKQAAMQQLLTGKTRLPGFGGKWETKRLRDVADLCPGINKPVSEMGAGALYVTVQDLYNGTSIRIEKLGRLRVSDAELQSHALLPGDIIFGKSSVKREGIGYPSIFLGAAEPAVCTGFAYRARALPALADARFLFYALRWEPTRRWIIDNSQASALTNINRGIADSIPILVPTLAEQTAIATVLSDLDAELTALEGRRDKTRALKQGMMQELLTGRTRLA